MTRDRTPVATAGTRGVCPRDLLLLFPGFMTPPGAYSQLTGEISRTGIEVEIVETDGSTLERLRGRVPLARDAEVLSDLAESRNSANDRVWIGGHSRGGGVAWLAARRMDADGAHLAGVVLLDPVWGDGGPRAVPPPLPDAPTAPTLILGFGVGGRCAPSGRNHEEFALAAPDAEHVVVPGCGHGDILDPTTARLAACLCGGGPDRSTARAAVARSVCDFIHS